MSARQQLSIKKWGRTITFLDGEAGMKFPADSVNAKLHGLTYKPRDGYNEAAVSPSGPLDTFAALGLGHIVDENEEALPNRPNYFVSVEDRNGTIMAYKVDEQTLVRNTDPLVSENLNGGNWLISQFYKDAFFINPSGTKTVYRHTAGSTKLDVIQDSAYSSPNNPDLTISTLEPSSIYQWDATDTIVFTNFAAYHVGTITKTYNTTDGSIKLNGPSNDVNGDDGGYLIIENRFATAKDLSGHEHLYINFQKEAYLKHFLPTSVLPEVKISGVWQNVTDAKWIVDPAGRSRATWVMTVSGLNMTSVEAFRLRMTCKPDRNHVSGPAQDFVTISPLMGGGTYITAASVTKRIWDKTLPTKSTTFGVVYWDGGTAYSEIAQQTIDDGQANGFYADDFACPVGGIIQLSCEDPVSPYTQAKFLRLDESVNPAKWKEISIDANKPMVYVESHREHEVSALTNYLSGSPPPTIPSFKTKGVRYAFPFKQSMIWLTSGGFGNIHISRVGKAEETYDSEVTYDEDDLTQPAQRTLADNQADQPVWGVQAGTNAFIVGEKAAYALQGDFPVNLSPSRQIPGSRGIAGPYAGCRFRPLSGEDGAAYLDSEGNVWLVNSIPGFTGDTRAKPFELSSLVRHKVKQFLLTEQLGEFPILSIANSLVEFQEATSSLWVILGKRAAVYRQDDSGSGWEFYEYQLTTPPGMEEVSTCRAYSPGSGTPTSVVRTGWTKDWGDPAYGAVDDENEASSGLLNYGDKTKILRSEGIPPAVLLPLSATLDKIKIRSRHRKVGEIDVFHDWTKLTLDGAPTGSNLALSEIVDTGQTTVDYEITTDLPSIADINDGKVGFETAYVASAGNPDWNDPDNYDIDVVQSGAFTDFFLGTASRTATITVDYTGSDPKPPNVDLNIIADAWVSAAIHLAPLYTPFSIYEGEATVSDGLGHSVSGSLYETELGVGKVEINGTSIMNVLLSDGHASFMLTSNSSIVNQNGSAGIAMDYIVTATMHPKMLSTVFVDSMEISYCFTVVASSEGADSGISWQRTCFTPESKYLAVRSSGQLDLVEYDFRNGSFIAGIGRDGGYPMPDWHLTLERLTFEGQTARLCGVQLNTIDKSDVFTASSRIGNGSFRSGTSTGTATSRWVRFPVSQIGISHQVKIAGDEAGDGIDGLAIEYQITSRRKVK